VIIPRAGRSNHTPGSGIGWILHPWPSARFAVRHLR
jgi:hypothetical protein